MMYLVRKILDKTLLRKERWLRCVSLSRKAAANIPTDPDINHNLVQSTLDDSLISRIQAFNGGFSSVGKN